jgi:hypothetical protein
MTALSLLAEGIVDSRERDIRKRVFLDTVVVQRYKFYYLFRGKHEAIYTTRRSS